MNPTPQTPPTQAEIEAALKRAIIALLAKSWDANEADDHARGVLWHFLHDQLPQLIADAGAYREMVAKGPVAWANYAPDLNSYAPERTREKAQASVDQSYIAATQDGPYFVVPLYTLPATAPAKDIAGRKCPECGVALVHIGPDYWEHPQGPLHFHCETYRQTLVAYSAAPAKDKSQ